MVVSIHPRRNGMAKGQRAILHSIRRSLRANARSLVRPRQPDSFEDAQRRDQFRLLLKRISKVGDRKMANRKIANFILSIASEAAGSRSANCPVCASRSLDHRRKLRKPNCPQVSFTRSVKEATQTGQLKFLHKSGIPLRPGGTADISRWRNHRIQSKTFIQPRRGDRPKLVCRPSGAGSISLIASSSYAPLHHRLMSAAPPAQKTCVETSAGQFALRSPNHLRKRQSVCTSRIFLSNIFLSAIFLFLFSPGAIAQTIRVNPTGVNVNVSGATTVFLTFGPVGNFRVAEATWCGELIPAAPDNGFKCDPATIFGSLPGRFDRSRSSGNLGFTDIMSIPPSVARRAYQAAQAGSVSSFFYVRHFINLGGGPDQGAGGPDEYVPVTCRLTGGGARTPFALTDVKVSFDTEAAENAIVFVAPGRKPPPIRARITYNGTGRLRGRWEVVLPGEQPPEDFDLLTEAALPIEQRAQQRRFTQISRFNLFLPPTGKYTLAGPDVARLPSTLEGQYIVLLRIEATDDKEADTDLSALGVGAGVVHSGGVAGFPIPVLRYFVGSGQANDIISLRLLTPAENAAAAADRPIDFSWTQARGVALYQLEIADQSGKVILSALLQPLTLNYRAPSWLRETVLGAGLQWRVSAIDQNGAKTVETPWRRLQLTLSR